MFLSSTEVPSAFNREKTAPDAHGFSVHLGRLYLFFFLLTRMLCTTVAVAQLGLSPDLPFGFPFWVIRHFGECGERGSERKSCPSSFQTVRSSLVPGDVSYTDTQRSSDAHFSVTCSIAQNMHGRYTYRRATGELAGTDTCRTKCLCQYPPLLPLAVPSILMALPQLCWHTEAPHSPKVILDGLVLNFA
jgi:hypothetical protein